MAALGGRVEGCCGRRIGRDRYWGQQALWAFERRCPGGVHWFEGERGSVEHHRTYFLEPPFSWHACASAELTTRRARADNVFVMLVRDARD